MYPIGCIREGHIVRAVCGEGHIAIKTGMAESCAARFHRAGATGTVKRDISILCRMTPDDFELRLIHSFCTRHNDFGLDDDKTCQPCSQHHSRHKTQDAVPPRVTHANASRISRTVLYHDADGRHHDADGRRRFCWVLPS